MVDNNNKFETKNVKECLDILGTSESKGLSFEEAENRLKTYGYNKLQEKKKKSIFKIFIEQLMDPMIYVLLAAVLVTLLISIVNVLNNKEGDWADIIIILVVIILNAVIGTVQEKKAQNSLEALQKMSSPESTVIRDGKRVRIKSELLVPGDIVILEEGDTIGADIRLIESVNLKTNESSLTGESLPVEKNKDIVFSDEVALGDRVNMAFMSTPVTYGRGKGVVTSTGMNSEIGKIATALENEEETETPLQKKLAQLSKILGILTLVIVVVVLIADIIWLAIGGSIGQLEPWMESILSSIALAVAAIPEGLPAVVTIVLAIGVQRMVKANTIVRKLPSVETLGAVSVVCSDKTGTLTQNKMTVMEAYLPGKYYQNSEFNSKNDDLKLLAKGMSLCSNATVDEGLYGDPTEIALVAFANEFDMHKSYLEEQSPRINELPFDSVRKMMSTHHKELEKYIQFTKGALDSILKYTKYILKDGQVVEITDKDIDEIYKANSYFSEKALRVLALAYKEDNSLSEENLIFVGLVAMIDPARPEAKGAVSQFKDAGITTVMITGDHKDTAFAIAKELGIATDISQCVMGQDIDGLTPEELQELVKNVRVFARVSPENKVSIVKAFKDNGNIVAMTGDGVNDAPSLKAADIGIAMGITGTDVAKSAADMVLTDDNFASIEKAVEEGRSIYANIKKTVLFLLSCNMGEVFSMFFMICIGLPAPLIAIHLLWVNLITDSLPAIALGMDPKDPNNMKDKPRDPNESIFAHHGYLAVFGYGLIISLITIAGFLLTAYHVFDVNGVAFTYQNLVNMSSLPDGETMLHHCQTVAFSVLAISQLFHMLGMSNLRESFVKVFTKKNWMMALAFAVGIALQLAVVEIPFLNNAFKTHNFDGFEWGIAFGLAVVPLALHEIVIFINYLRKKFKKTPSIN
ncbi:MAG: calcium-translocating P-type ATPase, PMCA-type [Candidatus Onthovivens sp.]|nr:calcium-translocating P-type ATPase, PMCA-type [Candidatus Onthovivens sp.]